MRRIPFALCVITVLLASACRTARPVPSASGPDPRWKEVDSLEAIGQYATALERTDALRSEAEAASDWRTEFAAWSRRGAYQEFTNVPEDTIIAQLDARAQGAPMPLAQLLRSALMDRWWRRYQRERWSILERTELGAAADASDPATWTQGRYMERIIGEARASLEPYDALRRIPVGELGNLLAGDTGAYYLRPTVYDVLAHRALAIFHNTEARLTEPAGRFSLSDTAYFGLFEPFLFRPLASADSSAWELQALRIHQRLERAHINDDRLDAYVDAALERLGFVRERSALPDRDSLYLAALEMLRTRLPQDACEAEVMVAIARWHEEMAGRYAPLTGNAWKWERKAALDLCEAAMAKWPGSFGARNAAALAARLRRPQVGIMAEQAVPKETESLALLRYSAAPRAWLRVVADPAADEPGSRYEPDRESWLLRQKPIAQWSIDLPDDGDLNPHAVEIGIAALPLGRYTVLASTSEAFTRSAGAIALCELAVTDLALAHRSDGLAQGLVVLHRATGMPVEGARVEALRESWESGQRRRKAIGSAITGEDGAARIEIAERGAFSFIVRHGDDRWVSGPHYAYDDGSQPEEGMRIFLFTDRAVYRPGQELLFKGIATVRRGKGAEIVPGRETEVRLRDANGEKVDAVALVADRFGAFHGRFIIPQGRLTGSWSIETDDGRRGIAVEEYKRPTFEAVFDPVEAAPRLGEEAVLTGTATSYAGAPLDGAAVRYTVLRRPRMPWWCGTRWGGLPWGRAAEIASGEAVCDAHGRFTVRFIARADRAFPPDADPVFSYEVSASVTDLSGESQEASAALQVGYRAIDLEMGIGSALDRSTADSALFRVLNLNGTPQDLPFSLRIARLRMPEGGPKRSRLWERPDRAVMSREEFERRFPGDAWADEADPGAWEPAEEVLRLDSVRAGGRPLALAGIGDWPVGTYRAEMEAADAAGRKVSAARTFTLFDTAIQLTGFENEAFHAEVVRGRCEPGGKAVLLLSTALPACRALMEVERDGRIAVSRPFPLQRGQQRVEIPVFEDDRGGFTVRFLCVERGRAHAVSHRIEVPWTDKQLKAEWMSFRDKMMPGAKEEWRLRITGPKKEGAAAQLLAVLYDASLDRFAQPSWDMDVWRSSGTRLDWARIVPFGTGRSRQMDALLGMVRDTSRSYPDLPDRAGGYGWVMRGGRANAVLAVAEGTVAMDEPLSLEEDKKLETGAVAPMQPPPPPAAPPAEAAPALRRDFRETAFFFPDLLTDRDGNVVLRFTMPDALTRWNFMGLAHTADLKAVAFTRSAVTQKPLMVVPHLPRFLRQGDRITLTAKVNALEGGPLSGTARLELFDPRTGGSIGGRFGLEAAARPFTVAPGSSAVVGWSVKVPDGAEAVAVRITAEAGGMGDGEERPLPILTDRVLITESLPLHIAKAGTKAFALESLVTARSATLRHQGLQLEFTPNPAWYAVRALPYLMEFPHECAEQIFSRCYANLLAEHIVQERPQVKQVLDAWAKGAPGSEQAFLSQLERNPEIKGIALEETPWLLQAKDERERLRRIALLFDLHRMAGERSAALAKLAEQQQPGGGWGWWSGMQPSRYITQLIVAGFGRLEQLGVTDQAMGAEAKRMTSKAIRWLDGEVERAHRLRLNAAKADSLPDPPAEDIHYIYARSFYPAQALERGKGSAAAFIIGRAERNWLRYGLQEQAMIAIALHRLAPGSAAPGLILESLSQRAAMSEELGMHWKEFHAGFAWNTLPIETHALLIEAYHEAARDPAKVDALRQHLLALKRTADWGTTKATADACYALLLAGPDWLGAKEPPVIRVGDREVKPAAAEAGTGFFEQAWPGEQVVPAMGRVTVTAKEDGAQWGALHWQYLEQMDKVRPPQEGMPFSLRRQVLLRESGDAGTRLVPIEGGRPLKPGERLTVRIELRTDRWLEYVHLKDLRAAGLEPVDQRSGYEWKGGLGFYRSVRDAAVHFFFDRIAPGTYVLEHELKVEHAGDFSNGIATVQCMYAPEFGGHSEGLRIAVGE